LSIERNKVPFSLSFSTQDSLNLIDLNRSLFRTGSKAADFLPVTAWVLDLLDHHQGRMAEVAAVLGVSTGNLVRFLSEDPDGWAAANRVRQQHGHKPLRQES
jgi:hypothetical protein